MSSKDKNQDVDKHAKCGVFNFRPDCLQVFNNMKVFTVIVSCYSLFGTVSFSYYSAVVYQIEKAYGLSSSASGFLKNVDNIGYMLTVMCFGHFCRYVNKPLIFFFAGLFSSTAIFLFAVPHFIYPPETDLEDLIPDKPYSNYTTSVKQDDDLYLCMDHSHQSQKGQLCQNLNNMYSFHVGAFAIFVTSELLQGMCNSPKYSMSITYIDDNSKESSPKLFSLMFAMRALGPLMGFSMGAWSTSMYVDLTDKPFDSKDPRWIGCWWIGFIICAACTLFWIFPIVLFPAKITKKDNKNKESIKSLTGDSKKESEKRETTPAVVQDDDSETVDVAAQIKDLPSALLRLFSNRIFVILIIATCMEMQMMGFATFTPKYLQLYFELTPSMASILTGVLFTLSFAVGPVVSGQIIGRGKVTPSWALRFMVIVGILSGGCFFIVYFLSCGSENWQTNMSVDELSLTEPCNSNCSCSEDLFLPVCGTNQVNYYSPCHAGCSNPSTLLDNKEVYSNCTCIPTPGGDAVKGKCSRNCQTLIPYLILIVVAKFLGSMDIVPKMTCVMRVINQRDKALAISAFTAIILVAAFPAPYFFGLVIDSTCVVFQSTCGQKGACLQYDVELFRTSIHMFGLSIKIASTCLYAIGWFLARRMEKQEEIKKQAELILTPINDNPQQIDSNSNIKSNSVMPLNVNNVNNVEKDDNTSNTNMTYRENQ